jgi:signal peptidase I
VKGTWPRALLELFGAILFVLTIRWALIEPYAIPSGSMIPTLLIHDHILVNKFAYGLRMPFQKNYLAHWSLPKRGEVIVFRSVENDDIYLVKRVIGLPGDTIEISETGTLSINGKTVEEGEVPPIPELDEFRDYRWVKETHDGGTSFVTIKDDSTASARGPFTVGAGQLFMMGDNREKSADSRVWGPLPIDNVLGRASLIWLSCEETLRDASRLCNPTTIRWKRMFQSL